MKIAIPDYDDGCFELYSYEDNNDVYPVKELKNLSCKIWFKELSVSDTLRNELLANKVDITMKIRIPQYKKLKNQINICKIEGTYHKIYNCYHFTDKDGFKHTDVTLERFKYDE